MRVLTQLLLLTSAVVTAAAPLSDTLPIQGRYSQGGRAVSRRAVEKFLLDQDSSRDLVSRSLRCKWGGYGVGAALWGVSLGITAYQVKQIYDAIQDESFIDDSTGMKEPFSNSLDRFVIPINIGMQVASFGQARLANRSDLLLHKASLAYNASVRARTHRDSVLDLRLEKVRFGVYRQGGLLVERPVLLGVLHEQPATAAHAVWSWSLNEVSAQVGSWGGTYLAIALISLLQETMGDTLYAIDKRAQSFNWAMGISLTAGSIVSAIASAIVRNVGIKRYNEALPRQRAVPAQQRTPQDGPAPDSSGTGIIEEPGAASPDTAGTVEE